MVDCFMMSQHKGADSVGRLAQQKELWGREPARDVSQLFHSTEGGDNKRMTNRKEDFAVGVRPVDVDGGRAVPLGVYAPRPKG